MGLVWLKYLYGITLHDGILKDSFSGLVSLLYS